MTDAAFCENCGTDRDQYGSPDRRLFHRCASCRLEVCPDCWNRGRDLCLNCAPFSVGVAAPARVPAAGGAASLAASVPPQPTGWTLVAPDDSPGAAAPATVVAPVAAATAAAFESVAASRVRPGDTLATFRRRGMAGLGALASGLGKPVRMATHAALLLCLTTLGLLVTWQLVSFAGTALPASTAPGALGAGPKASADASASAVDVGVSPLPAGGAGGDQGDHDPGQTGSGGGDGSPGGRRPDPAGHAAPDSLADRDADGRTDHDADAGTDGDRHAGTDPHRHPDGCSHRHATADPRPTRRYLRPPIRRGPSRRRPGRSLTPTGALGYPPDLRSRRVARAL